jgi:hypothetical protein
MKKPLYFSLSALKRIASLFVLAIVTFPLLSCGSKNVGQMLDDVEGQIQKMAGGLGSTADLTELQLLDTLLMKVKELREQWKDVLGDTVDKLDLEQQKTLDTLTQATSKVHGVLDHVTQIQDYAVLDMNVLLSKVGLASNDQIRRVTPSAQSFKKAGLYTYRITLPLFGTGNKVEQISIGDVDVTQWKRDDPPHAIILDVPVKQMDHLFDEWDLKRPELKIHLKGQKSWWQFWAKDPESDVVIHTGTFPRQPIRYWFAEHPHHSEVDMAQFAEVSSPPTMIPGCGSSGCYRSWEVCAVAPVGTAPTGELLEKHDSFGGWGDFLPPPRVSTNLTCMTYQQHSHDTNRSVWFKTRYHPLVDKEDTNYFTLLPLTADGEAKPSVNKPAQQGSSAAVANLNAAVSQLVLLGGAISASASITTSGSGPVSNPTYNPPNGDTGPTPRPMSLEATYVVQVPQPDIGWELVAQPFTGNPIILSPTKLSDPMITVRREPGRLLIETKSPF